jgi:hypothetical protein
MFSSHVKKFAPHWATKTKCKAAHAELERNFMPTQRLLDVDFAENFTIMLGREIQVVMRYYTCCFV